MWMLMLLLIYTNYFFYSYEQEREYIYIHELTFIIRSIDVNLIRLFTGSIAFPPDPELVVVVVVADCSRLSTT